MQAGGGGPRLVVATAQGPAGRTAGALPGTNTEFRDSTYCRWPTDPEAGCSCLHHSRRTQGAGASFAANVVGHFPWFAVYNLCDKHLPEPADVRGRLLRNATMGFAGKGVDSMFCQGAGGMRLVILLELIDQYPVHTRSELRLGRALQQPDGGESVQASKRGRGLIPAGPCPIASHMAQMQSASHLYQTDSSFTVTHNRRPSTSSRRTVSRACWDGGSESASLPTGCRLGSPSHFQLPTCIKCSILHFP